jgi:curved DNA-binding protein CbpA
VTVQRDYFAILEITASAGEQEIRSAYRRLARRYHPDLHPERADGEQRLKEINEAYAVLSDPGQRARYLQTRHVRIRVEPTSPPAAAPRRPPRQPVPPRSTAPHPPADVVYGSHVDLSGGYGWPRAFQGLGTGFRAPYGSPAPRRTIGDEELALLYMRRLLRALFGW